jgi:hypothetical protein
MFKKLLPLFFLFAGFQANAAIITFNGTVGDESVAYQALGSVYTESGFSMEVTDVGRVNFVDNDFASGVFPLFPSWDDDVLEFDATGSAVTFSQDGGGLFDFLSLDFGYLNSSAIIGFEGVFGAGGSTVILHTTPGSGVGEIN